MILATDFFHQFVDFLGGVRGAEDVFPLKEKYVVLGNFIQLGLVDSSIVAKAYCYNVALLFFLKRIG